MITPTTISMIRDIVAIFGVIAGFTYYVLTVQATRKNQELTLKSRNAAVFHNVIGQFLTNADGIKHIQTITDNPISSVEENNELWSNPDYRTAVVWFWSLYDTAGIYVREGVVDIDMFARYQPYWHMHFWNTYKDVIHSSRKRLGPSFFRNMEYLMEKLIEYYKEHPELGP